MITLYTHPMSPCAQKVRIALAEKGLTWEKRHIDLPAKENLQPWYLALNPLGVVPTLVDDDKAVIESSIILEYLEDCYPQPSLRPDDAHARAAMRFWMKHVDIKLHPACGALQWPLAMRPGFLKLPESEREKLLDAIPEKPRRERQKRLVAQGLEAPDVVDAVATYCRTISDMDQRLAVTEWLVANEFTLADVAVAPYFQTLMQYGWSEFYEADFPRVGDWYARCRERASYQEAVAADFSAEKSAALLAQGRAAWSRVAPHRPAAFNKNI